MALARETARRSTCVRRSVGAVLLDGRGHVVGTGYNGVAAGRPHCNDVVFKDQTFAGWDPADLDETVVERPHACPGWDRPMGQSGGACQAVHAEQNALLQCRDPWAVRSCYVTVSPCVPCAKVLLNTSCERVVFAEESHHAEAEDLWTSAGRLWVRL